MTRIAIVADDLTGAADAAVPFAIAGCVTALPLRAVPAGATVISVSTDSRDLPPDAAADAVRQTLTRLIDGGYRPSLTYKKIDSALRGQIAAELAATIGVLGVRRAVVAPALPSQGRTTRGGRQHADGSPLELSSFAGDDTRSDIVALLSNSAVGLPVRLVTVETVRAGLAELSGALRADGIAVVDAEMDHDLDQVASAASRLGFELMAGSAGLARALARLTTCEPAALATKPGPERGMPVLVVAGSRHDATARQVALLAKHAALVRTDQAELDDPGEHLGDATAAVERALAAGRHTVLTTAGCRPSPAGSLSVAARLARVVESERVRALAGGLVVTGGDVAAAVCAALAADAIVLRGEVQPAIPWGTLEGGALPGIPIVTKAGSFGDDDALVVAVERLSGASHPG